MELGLEFDDHRKHLASLVALVYGDSQVLVDWWERSDSRPSTIDLFAKLFSFARSGVRQVVFSAGSVQTA